MAKNQSKKKTDRNKSVEIDTLALSLQGLAAYDQASTVAITALGYVLQISVVPPDLTMCTFDLDGEQYSALVTADQCVVILEAVNLTNDRKKIEAAVNGLFGAVSLAVSNAFNDLENQPAGPAASSGARKGLLGPLVKAVVGCCVYDGGKLPNVTQSVCDTYSPTSWGPPADCMTASPPKKKK